MDDKETVTKRILETTRETERLKEELQNLIAAGVKGNLNIPSFNKSPLESNNKVQIIKSYDSKHSYHPKKSEENVDLKLKDKASELSIKKHKNYDVEVAREYIKKQKEKRLADIKSKKGVPKSAIDLRKEKLQELQRKASELVKKNVEAQRHRSKSREPPITRSRSASGEREPVLKPRLFSRDKSPRESIIYGFNCASRSTAWVKSNIANVVETEPNKNEIDRNHLKLPSQPRSRSREKKPISKTNLVFKDESQGNLNVPYNYSVRNKSYLENDNSHLKKILVNYNENISKAGSPPPIASSEKSSNVVLTARGSYNYQPGSNMKLDVPVKNLKSLYPPNAQESVIYLEEPEINLYSQKFEKPLSDAATNIWSSDDQNKLTTNEVEPDLHLKNPNLLHPPNSQDVSYKEPAISPRSRKMRKHSDGTHKHEWSEQARNKIKERLSKRLFASESKKIDSKESDKKIIIHSNITLRSGIKEPHPLEIQQEKTDYPDWLQESAPQSDPYNFINTLKRQLRYITNDTKPHYVDVAVQGSFNDISESKSKHSSLKSFISHKCADSKLLEHVEIDGKKEVSKFKDGNTVTKYTNSENESDTSKNIPSISSESGTSLRRNAEFVQSLKDPQFNEPSNNKCLEDAQFNNSSEKLSQNAECMIDILKPKSDFSALDSLSVPITEISNKISTSSHKSRKKLPRSISEQIISQKIKQDSMSQLNFDADKENINLPLKEPKLCLKITERNRNDKNDMEKHVLMKNISFRTRNAGAEALNNTNEIHLKFEAEIHLLNDFNRSLKHFAEIEKAFESLRSRNDSEYMTKKILLNRDTQTSINSSLSKDKKNEETSQISTINYSRGVECGSELVDEPQYNTETSEIISLTDNSEFNKLLNSVDFDDTIANNSSEKTNSVIKFSDNTINGSDSKKSQYAGFSDENQLFKNFAGLSLEMFDQLIKDEDVRIENLKKMVKIREQALLDKTRSELVWLEMQRKQFIQTKRFDKASLIKRKQRGILLRHQQEKQEMQRLKQMQKEASNERRTVLKQQRNRIKNQLLSDAMLSKIKSGNHRERNDRRTSGPLKVIQASSIHSEGSLSIAPTATDQEIKSITSKTCSIISILSGPTDNNLQSEIEPVDLKNKQNKNMKASIISSMKKKLLMREQALAKRRRTVEELLQWHQKLMEEEKVIEDLENKIKTIVSKIPSEKDEERLRLSASLSKDVAEKTSSTEQHSLMSQANLDTAPSEINKNIPQNQQEELGSDNSSKVISTAKYVADFEDCSSISSISQLIDDFSKIEDNILNLSIVHCAKDINKEGRHEENISANSSVSSLVRSEIEVPLNQIEENGAIEAPLEQVLEEKNISDSLSNHSDHESKEDYAIHSLAAEQPLSEIESKLHEDGPSSVNNNENFADNKSPSNEVKLDNCTSEEIVTKTVPETQESELVESLTAPSESVVSILNSQADDSDVNEKPAKAVQEILPKEPVTGDYEQTIYSECKKDTIPLDENDFVIENIVSDTCNSGNEQDLPTDKDIENAQPEIESTGNSVCEENNNLTNIQDDTCQILDLQPEKSTSQEGISPPKLNDDIEDFATNKQELPSTSCQTFEEATSSQVWSEAKEEVPDNLEETFTSTSSSIVENLSPEERQYSENKTDEEKVASLSNKANRNQKELLNQDTSQSLSDRNSSLLNNKSVVSLPNEVSEESLSDVATKIDLSEQESSPTSSQNKEVITSSKSTEDFTQDPGNDICLTEANSLKSPILEENSTISEEKPTKGLEEKFATVNSSDKTVKPSVNVKKRVQEILNETTGASRGDKSPRMQDLCVMTYDVASSDQAPDLGSSVEERKSFSLGSEAEELLRKQLAIEQEIKLLTEQQQKEQIPLAYIREIPNKPPPPYTPPFKTKVVKVVSIVPTTKDEIDQITEYSAKIIHKAYMSNNLDNISISDNTLSLIAKNIDKGCYKYVFDLCKEIAINHYNQFVRDTPGPSWLQVEKRVFSIQSKPLDVKGLQQLMNKKLLELFGFQKPEIMKRENTIMKWSRKKRDHVDEVLVQEMQNEELSWTNFDQDELIVKDRITNELMDMLLKETVQVLKKTFNKKSENQ